MAIHTSLKKGGDDVVAVGDSFLSIGTYELDMVDVAALTFTTADQVLALDLPADTYWELIQAECVTALTGITRIDIGDEDDDDEMVSNASTVTAGTNFTLTKATHTDGPVVLAASKIYVKVTGTPSTGILRLRYLMGSSVRNPIASYRTYPN